MIPTYQRCLVLATLTVLVAGCGSKGLDSPPPKADQTLVVKAPWANGARIPRQFTCDGGDHKPRISFSGAAFGKASAPKDFAIVMSDPDAPGGTFVHWTSWGRRVEGTNSFGDKGYKGPCPPKGDKPHRYVVTVYALRRVLGLPSGSDAADVVAAIRKAVIASGSVSGTYGR